MDKRMLKITITQLRQIALFAVGMSLLTACGNSQSGMKLGDAEFAVMAVNSTTSDQTTSYPATIKGTQDIEVRPQVSGFIVKLCVDEGATVRKGQALFQIDPTQYAAAVGQAKAAVEMAKANVSTLTLTERNKKTLFDQKIISDFEYQTAVNQLMSDAVGLKGHDIMFSSNVTPAEDFKKAAELGAIINFDDVSLIDFYEEIGAPFLETMCCRYNPGGNFTLHNEIMDTPKDAKYGMTKEQMKDAFTKLKAHGVKHFGIHAFLASNTVALGYYPKLARILFELAVELSKEVGVHIAFVNLSGRCRLQKFSVWNWKK